MATRRICLGGLFLFYHITLTSTNYTLSTIINYRHPAYTLGVRIIIYRIICMTHTDWGHRTRVVHSPPTA